jgi:hypothetical protein
MGQKTANESREGTENGKIIETGDRKQQKNQDRA